MQYRHLTQVHIYIHISIYILILKLEQVGFLGREGVARVAKRAGARGRRGGHEEIHIYRILHHIVPYLCNKNQIILSI